MDRFIRAGDVFLFVERYHPVSDDDIITILHVEGEHFFMHDGRNGFRSYSLYDLMTISDWKRAGWKLLEAE